MYQKIYKKWDINAPFPLLEIEIFSCLNVYEVLIKIATFATNGRLQKCTSYLDLSSMLEHRKIRIMKLKTQTDPDAHNYLTEPYLEKNA